MPVSPDQFRAALGAYPTGVTVVTAIGESGPSGALFRPAGLPPLFVVIVAEDMIGG